MVNKLFKVITAVLLTASLSHADGGDIFDIKMGVGTWIAGVPEGKVGTTAADSIDMVSQFNLDGGAQTYAWAEFQHFIPIIPHFRVEFSDMSFMGIPSIDITIAGVPYNFTGEAEMAIRNLDTILFYDIELFDADINFGVGLKVLDGNIIGTVAGQTETLPLPGVAVYTYVDVRVEPMLGLGVEVAYKWFPDGITTAFVFNEYIAKVDYTFDFGWVKFGAEGGLRGMNLTIDTGSVYYAQNMGGVFFGGFAKLGI